MLHKQAITLTVGKRGLLPALKARFPKCRVTILHNFILILDDTIGFRRHYRDIGRRQVACTHIIKMPDALFQKHCNPGSSIAGKWRLEVCIANDDADNYLFDWNKR